MRKHELIKRMLGVGSMVLLMLAAVPASAGYWQMDCWPGSSPVLSTLRHTPNAYATVSGLLGGPAVGNVIMVSSTASVYSFSSGATAASERADVNYSGWNWMWEYHASGPGDHPGPWGIRIVQSWSGSAAASNAPTGEASAFGTGFPAEQLLIEHTNLGDTGVTAVSPGTGSGLGHLWPGIGQGIESYTGPGYEDVNSKLLMGGRIAADGTNFAADVAMEMSWYEMHMPAYVIDRYSNVIWSPTGTSGVLTLNNVTVRTEDTTLGGADSFFHHMITVQGLY